MKNNALETAINLFFEINKLVLYRIKEMPNKRTSFNILKIAKFLNDKIISNL